MGSRARSILGYSLIELLVTLLIVAALIGLLLPMLQRARASAEKSQCLSHQASNGRSMLMHVYDQDGRFPPMFHSFSPGQSGMIVVRIQPRTPAEAGIDRMEQKNLICPGDREHGTVPVRRENEVSHQVMSYSYNIELAIKQATVDGLPRPARMAVLYDGSMSGPDHGKDVEGVYASSYAFAAVAQTSRHNAAVNVLFADWHARTIEQIEPEHVLLR